MAAPDIVSPGGTVGILGGGQLGRMLSMAAARLGIQCHIYAPEADSPAFQVSAFKTIAAYDDRAALTAFGKSVDVITYEFENVPGETAALLGALHPVRPGPRALAISQDRWSEKSFLRDQGIGTAPFASIESEAQARDAFAKIGGPAVIKTRRFGYDGKGQKLVRSADETVAAWHSFKNAPSILEGFVDFTRELSVVAARGIDGSTRSYDLVENVHENHILRTTLAPARASQALQSDAARLADKILNALDYVGVIAIELFETRDGKLLVNELAPRVHNSGHWTGDACAVGQFEQHIRAICGWPLGDPSRHSDAIMRNLLGDEADGWKAEASVGHSALHLYGKGEAKPGRKMGHVTRLFPFGKRPDA